MKLEGKVAIITGAGSGIGATTAVLFASNGAQLALTGRNESNLKKVAEECKEAGKRDPLIIVADLMKEADVQKIVDETIKKYGKLDILVNNAGIFRVNTIETPSLPDFDSIFKTNVRAPYHLTSLAVPHLMKSKGNVVNVSSMAGTGTYPDFTVYCMSKSALDQLTKCTALQLAPKGVRVNSVNPAVIVTEIHKKAGMSAARYEQFLVDCKKTHPLGRAGEANEVAAAILFLASNDASFITGELLHVDGGRHVNCPVEPMD
ncbi:hypothetical protein RUM44_005286 [Polyplax serrata]|uniref:Uncharacterized protein n=1 Tax=Polyplax serrata TaxID=468196 RepID=A0ABR1AFY1_POLSC